MLGFARIRRLALLGDNLAGHLLRLKVAYDFDTYWEGNYVFDSTMGAATPTPYWGIAEQHDLDGGASTREDKSYMLQKHLPRQKCTAIRLQISDEEPTKSVVYVAGGGNGYPDPPGQIWKSVDGGAFAAVSVPDSVFAGYAGITNLINSMPKQCFGFGGDELWVALSDEGAILHLSDGTWTLLWAEVGNAASGLPDEAANTTINGLFGISREDVYFSYDLGGKIGAHWDGTSWSHNSDDPGTGVFGNRMAVTWGYDADNVFLADWSGNVWRGSHENWPDAGVATGASDIFSIAGIDQNAIWVGGDSGDIYFSSDNGKTWTSQATPAAVVDRIVGMWACRTPTADVCWAITDGAGGLGVGKVIYFDGTSWSEQYSNANLAFDDTDSGGGIFGLSATEVYAVGWNHNASTGVILKYDGSSWTDVTPSGTGDDYLRGVWGTDYTEDGEGFSISGLAFLVAAKGGLVRLGSTRTI